MNNIQSQTDCIPSLFPGVPPTIRSGPTLCKPFREGDVQEKYRGSTGEVQGKYRGSTGEVQEKYRGSTGEVQLCCLRSSLCHSQIISLDLKARERI